MSRPRLNLDLDLNGSWKYKTEKGVAYGGDYLEGKVTVSTDREVDIIDLEVAVTGSGHVAWTYYKTVYIWQHLTPVLTNVERDQSYLSQSRSILKTQDSAETKLKPGIREFPFSFKLPDKLPSSIESPSGYIRYTCQATLRLSPTLDVPSSELEASKTFTLVSPVVLGKLVAANKPFSKTYIFAFGWGCCKSGTIETQLHIPRLVFAAGEVVSVSVNLVNRSQKTLRSLVSELNQTIIYVGNNRASKKKSRTVARSEVNPKAPQGQHFEIQLQLLVPALPPSQSQFIINIQYQLIVKITPGPQFAIPMVIGSIPLNWEQKLNAGPPACEPSPWERGLDGGGPSSPETSSLFLNHYPCWPSTADG